MSDSSVAFILNPDVKSSLQFCTKNQYLPISAVYTGLWGLLLCRYLELESIELEYCLDSAPQQKQPFSRLSCSPRPEDRLGSLVADVANLLPPWNEQADFIVTPVRTDQEREDVWSLWDVRLRIEGNGSFCLVHAAGQHQEWFIRQVAGHLQFLLESWIAQPELGVFDFPLLLNHEKEKILIEFNRTERPFPQDKTLQQLFEEQTARTPDAIAVVAPDGALTYTELNSRANRLAYAIRAHYRLLHQQDMLPDTLIGLCLGRCCGMIVAMLGILKAGGAYLPLDPEYPAERLRFMMDDARAPLVVTERLFLEKLLFLYEQDYGVISLDGGWDFISRYPDTNPEPLSGPEHLAYVVYTSGSTGRPKGTLISQRGVVNFAWDEIAFQEIGPHDRLLQTSSINFDGAVLEIAPALLGGATLHIVSEDVRKDPVALFQYCQEQAITRAFITPAVLHAMPKADLPALRLLLVGGDICIKEDLAFWRQGRTCYNVYGPTECTVLSTANRLDQASRHTEIGRPLGNMKAYVLDQAQNPVPVGVGGELYLGGEGVGRGYLNQPELTARCFIPNPFAKPEEASSSRNTNLYRSGDRVRWLPTGSIEFLGRLDSQVKIRNFRIEPGEIEAVLLRHADVRECAVAPFGQGPEKRLAAYFVPVSGHSPSLADLRLALAQQLPQYMLPAVFVPMDALPLTPNKKLDRKALPFPDASNILKETATEEQFRAPRTPLEEEVAGIVGPILNQERLGVDQDFFELGAYSLMAARMAAELRQRFQTRVEIRDVFENPTVEKLAARLSRTPEQGREESPGIVRAPHRHFIPLSYQQEQVWFLSKLAPENRAYNFQMTIRLEGALELGTLTAVLEEIVRRQEILRTSFRESRYGPVQVVHPPWKAKFPVVDLTSLPATEREVESKHRIREELAKPFDYTRLPLLRWVLYKLDDRVHLLLHMEHHFVHDGWSVSVFLNEFKVLYTAFQQGRPSPLPELPIQYADYAIWQRQYLSGATRQAKLDYWEKRLEGFPHFLDLPQDHSRPALQSFNGGMLRLDLKEPYQRLRQFSRQHNVTLFNTMFSVFCVLLARYCRQERFLVGTGVVNRGFPETLGMLGMFVNTALLCPDLSGNPTFLELIAATRQDMLRDGAHYDIPFMDIVKGLKAGNQGGRNPLFQVMFAFHDNPVPYLDFAGLRGNIGIEHNATAKMDINVVCIPRAEQHAAIKDAPLENEDVSILWEYNSDLFDQATMQGMLDTYVTLLERLTAQPETRVMETNLLRPGERDRLLAAHRSARLAYNAQQTLHGLFTERVRSRQDRIAVRHGDVALTWRELDARANVVANRLRHGYASALASELGPDTLVGLCLERSPDMIVGMLGILKAGGAYVPLPPSYPANRLRFIMQDANIRAVLTQEAVSSHVPYLAEEGRLVIPIDPWNLEDADDSPLEDRNRQGDIAYVIYTSGSTGTPKGVCIPHQAVNNFLQSVRQDILRESDRVAQIASYAFDGSVFEIWGGLLVADGIVIIDPDTIENISLLQRDLEKHQITAAFFTTAFFNIIADCAPELLFALRLAAFGGEAANPACIRKLLVAKPDTLKLVNGYGPTECTCFSVWCTLAGHHAELDRIPIGIPLHNYTASLLDERMRPVPDGMPGELYIGGDSLARGYLNQPELTTHRFVDNPFVLPDDAARGFNTRLYKTGDVMRRDSRGELVFLGRTDFQVKVRGFRIEPEEVEIALQHHEAVKHCVVMARDQELLAYWTANNPETAPGAEALRAFLATTLPPFMLPAAFIRLESFPLNSSLKVDRARLPPPRPEDMSVGKDDFQPPSGRTEEIVHELWQELLRIERIGVDANFFELGGNSLLTVRMLSGLKRRLGVELNLSQLYANPTIRAIAGHIDGTGISSGQVDDNLALALQDSRLGLETKWTSEGDLAHPRTILLTGVTGLLGRYLLEALLEASQAQIYCLIRGDAPQARLDEALARGGKRNLRGNPRILPLQGDLEEPGLGLADDTLAWLRENLDAIVHCGALVHHIYDYQRLRKANVLSTTELLRIASQGRRKGFCFISTLGTSSIRDDKGATVEVDASRAPVSTNGYILSKWVCERILCRSGQYNLPVSIFRPGNITGDSATGFCRPQLNHTLLRIKGCIQLQAAPDWKRMTEMVPVDTLASAIVRLWLAASGSNIYNMNNPYEIPWSEYVDLFRKEGFPIHIISENVWRDTYLENIDENNALYTIKDFYGKKDVSPNHRKWKPFCHYNSSEVQKLLAQIGISYPVNYENHMALVISYLMQSGFLSRPA